MADHAQEQGAAWLPRVDVVPVLAMLKVSRVLGLPSRSLTLSPSLWPRLSPSSARHRATVSSTVRSSATTASQLNCAGQNLRHDLLFTLLPLDSPAEPQVERKKSFCRRRHARSAAEFLHRRGYATMAHLSPSYRVHCVRSAT
jgi:hypothetical protein